MDTWGAGSTVCINYRVTDCDEIPRDPASQTFRVRLPNGTVMPVVPTPTGLGAFAAFIETAVGQEGQWWWSVVTEDPDTTDDDSFVVTKHAAA